MYECCVDGMNFEEFFEGMLVKKFSCEKFCYYSYYKDVCITFLHQLILDTHK